MKFKTLATILLILSFGLNASFSQSLKDTSVVDYPIIDKFIRMKVEKFGAQNVLVVMDIDNTILTGDADLGSDIWYQWQAGELEVKPTPEQKIAKDCMYNEAIGLLYELGTMTLTDSLLPGYIKSWQNAGVTLFALTSRSPGYRAATERELLKNHIDLSAAELKTIDGNELSLDYNLGRNLSYNNGIMMTTGMNKGKMLEHLLGRSGRSFKAIIFIDDTRKNIDAVKNEYAPCNDLDILLFHYTKIISERLNLNKNTILTPEQAEKMDQGWDELIRTLNTTFPDRITKSDCSKRVCFSVDDLPCVSYGITDSSYRQALVSKMIRSLNDNNVPAIGFVNEDKLYKDGALLSYQAGILRNWAGSGLDLGNHTYSHPDYNKFSLKDFTEDIIKGETVLKNILAEYGKSLKYFRHPYLHVGNTAEKADSLDEFLAGRGYTTAPVTIDNEDYLFAKAYHTANQEKDTVLMNRIGRDYILYMEKKLIFYEMLSDSLFDRNISQILLIHASLLNADYLGELIELFKNYNYSFISMDQALEDPAYLTLVTVYSNRGISWIDRWALSAGKKGNFFKDDPVTPEYIKKLSE